MMFQKINDPYIATCLIWNNGTLPYTFHFIAVKHGFLSDLSDKRRSFER